MSLFDKVRPQIGSEDDLDSPPVIASEEAETEDLFVDMLKGIALTLRSG
jgi:hypothetical protein